MKLEFKVVKKNLIVKFFGELDHHTSSKVREEIQWQMENNPVVDLVFDCHGLTFMDSSGVGLLIGRYKEVKERGGKLKMVGLGPQVKKVYEISGLNKYIETYETLDKAIL